MEPKNLEVDVNVHFNTNYPVPPSTMEDRIKAAQVSKPLLTGSTLVSSGGAGVYDLIRMAEYIATGHDYMDTHRADLKADLKADKKADKKASKKLRKEIRKIVQEEVEEELDLRSKAGAGTLVIPETLIERPDGSTYKGEPFIVLKDVEEESDGDVETRPEDADVEKEAREVCAHCEQPIEKVGETQQWRHIGTMGRYCNSNKLDAVATPMRREAQ